MMIAHYTQAAMAMEAKRLAVPASTESLPTSAMQEDHVSNGWAAARKLRRAVDNLRRVLAVELVCAAAAIDLRAPAAARRRAPVPRSLVLREQVAGPGPDRWLSPDLRAAEQLLADGSGPRRRRIRHRNPGGPLTWKAPVPFVPRAAPS